MEKIILQNGKPLKLFKRKKMCDLKDFLSIYENDKDFFNWLYPSNTFCLLKQKEHYNLFILNPRTTKNINIKMLEFYDSEDVYFELMEDFELDMKEFEHEEKIKQYKVEIPKQLINIKIGHNQGKISTVNYFLVFVEDTFLESETDLQKYKESIFKFYKNKYHFSFRDFINETKNLYNYYRGFLPNQYQDNFRICTEQNFKKEFIKDPNVDIFASLYNYDLSEESVLYYATNRKIFKFGFKDHFNFLSDNPTQHSLFNLLKTNTEEFYNIYFEKINSLKINELIKF